MQRSLADEMLMYQKRGNNETERGQLSLGVRTIISVIDRHSQTIFPISIRWRREMCSSLLNWHISLSCVFIFCKATTFCNATSLSGTPLQMHSTQSELALVLYSDHSDYFSLYLLWSLHCVRCWHNELFTRWLLIPLYGYGMWLVGCYIMFVVLE